ncbi:MAG: hypothetical protein SLAVMIC_00496 [uncultured marine phage]|uniref:Uncharacterized protein n=1 Tax=uncultured marine phage TaxID=707152 RepID=A0A8D9FS70_9VIRU|nr:MAG: hypothetical protein SLAVMIC_00496 [uncultured marine phage]
MKYIRSYTQYSARKINEGWLSDKMKDWDNDIKDVMVNFVTPFKDLIEKIKDWKTVTDPEKVKNDIEDVMDKSFGSLDKSIDKIEKGETFYRLYDDIDQMIVQLNDVFNKELERLTESVESTAAGLKYVIGGLLDAFKEKFKEFKTEYIDKLTELTEIDDKRTEVKKYLKEIWDKVKTDMKSVDVDVLMTKGESTVKGEEKVNKNLELKADDRVRYSKKNDDENIAIVATNQEDVEDPDEMVKLRSEDGNDTFMINKNQIIEVITDEEDTETKPEDVTNKIDSIKGDKEKLQKVDDFIDKLNEE